MIEEISKIIYSNVFLKSILFNIFKKTKNNPFLVLFLVVDVSSALQYKQYSCGGKENFAHFALNYSEV